MQDPSCTLHGHACVCRDRQREPGDKTTGRWDRCGTASAQPRAPRPHCKLAGAGAAFLMLELSPPGGQKPQHLCSLLPAASGTTQGSPWQSRGEHQTLASVPRGRRELARLPPLSRSAFAKGAATQRGCVQRPGCFLPGGTPQPCAGLAPEQARVRWLSAAWELVGARLRVRGAPGRLRAGCSVAPLRPRMHRIIKAANYQSPEPCLPQFPGLFCSFPLLPCQQHGCEAAGCISGTCSGSSGAAPGSVTRMAMLNSPLGTHSSFPSTRGGGATLSNLQLGGGRPCPPSPRRSSLCSAAHRHQ